MDKAAMGIFFVLDLYAIAKDGDFLEDGLNKFVFLDGIHDIPDGAEVRENGSTERQTSCQTDSFIQKKSDRYEHKLTVRIMSRFNEGILCPECKCEGRRHPDYQKAVDAELADIRRSNMNIPGVIWLWKNSRMKPVFRPPFHAAGCFRPVWPMSRAKHTEFRRENIPDDFLTVTRTRSTNMETDIPNDGVLREYNRGRQEDKWKNSFTIN